MSVLVSSPRSPLSIIAITWVLFVALPTALIWSLWNQGLAWDETRQSERRQSLLTREMQAFSQELETPAFIEARCASILHALWKRDFESGRRFPAAEPGGAARLRRIFERRFTFPVTAMIWHGRDTDECWADTDKNWDSSPSRRGLLQIMAQTNGQLWRQRHSSPPPVWQEQLGRLTEVQKNNLIRGLGRTLFGDIIRAQLQPWKAVPFLSRNGGGGRMFAFYAVFPTHEASDAPVLGGCLILVRERDLDPDRLLALACRQPLHREIRRTRRRLSAQEAQASESLTLPTFRADNVGEHLLARPREWFLGLVASRGTFKAYPGADQYLLQITLPVRFRENPLRAWLPYLEGFLQITFLLGSLLFIRLACFGFAFPLRLRGKILIGAVLAGVFPIGILVLGLVLQHRLQLDRTRETLSRRLQSHQQFIEHLFRSYLTEVGQTLLNRAEELRPIASTSIPLASAFKNTFRSLPVRDIFAVAADRLPFRWSESSGRHSDSSDIEEAVLLSLAKAFHLGVDPATRHLTPTVTVHGVGMRLTGVGDLLARPGYLVHTDLLAGRQMIVTGIPLPLASGAAGLLVRFRPEDLLQDFFQKHEGHLRRAQEHTMDWALSLTALRLDTQSTNRVIGSFWEPQPGAWQPLRQYLERPIRLGLNVEGESVVNGNISRIFTTALIPRFPCLLVGWAETSQSSNFLPILSGALLYFLLLFGFIVLLLEQVFRRPILFFAQAAADIEEGRYPSQPPVSGNDELGQLGQAFGEMTQGLRQRDELSQFVSAEVMTAVQAESDEGLKPGGELMPVTILFAGLRGFRANASQRSLAESLSILNGFLDKADQVLREQGGSLDKMIEDTAMGVFRPRPNAEPSSVRAVKAAFQLQKTLIAFWNHEGLACDIGIAHGTVLSGRIGSRHGTLDFSVIGNAVNLAARLKAVARKAQITGILVDPHAIHQARGAFTFQFLERASIKGRTRSFNLYEALGIRE